MSDETAIRKLYVYVDESGSETEGRLFIVAVVLTDGDPQGIIRLCEDLEQVSGKQKAKWGKSAHPLRMKYIRAVFANPILHGCLCYALFEDTRDFDAATINGIGRSIQYFAASSKYSANIYVDALSKSKRHEYGPRLRKAGIKISKIQGIDRDESHALIRLADALAGFIRDALESKSREIKELFELARRENILIEV